MANTKKTTKSNTTKENQKFMLLILVLLLTVVSVYVVSSTYAKYTSKISGSDNATVAKWAWKVNEQDINLGGKAFTMNLFDSSNLLELDASNNCGTSAETDVVTSKTLIAPGTCGKFAITLENTSEVNATYQYALSIENTQNVPLQFSKDNKTWGSLDSLNLSGSVNAGATHESDTIYWRWLYTGSSDEKDTSLGTAAEAPTVTLVADLTLTQVD